MIPRVKEERRRPPAVVQVAILVQLLAVLPFVLQVGSLVRSAYEEGRVHPVGLAFALFFAATAVFLAAVAWAWLRRRPWARHGTIVAGAGLSAGVGYFLAMGSEPVWALILMIPFFGLTLILGASTMAARGWVGSSESGNRLE